MLCEALIRAKDVRWLMNGKEKQSDHETIEPSYHDIKPRN